MSLGFLGRTSVLLTGLLTALDAAFAVPVNGSYRRLSGEEYARAHRFVVKVAGPTAPVLAVPLVVTNALMHLKMRGDRERGFGWVALSTVCLLTNAAITFVINVPINDKFTRAPEDSPPDDWRELRDRWATAHNARTSVQTLGFAALLIGLKRSSPGETGLKIPLPEGK